MTKREKIARRAKEILASCPEGIRWSELVRRLHQAFPGEPHGTITGSAYNFGRSDEVYRPAKGLLRLTRFRSSGASPGSALPPQVARTSKATMSSLSEAIGFVRRRIAQHKGKGLTEQDTKTALIDPILRALKWDVGNLDEVRQEYKAAPAHNPVDYALLVSGEVRLLVEAKALDQHLEGGRWADKIMGYAGAAGAEWVVLTNGDEYRIYNACAPVPFDKKLFRQPVRVTASGPQANETEETLILLSKDRIDGIREQWERYFDDGQVRAALERILSPECNQQLVRLVKKSVEGLSSKRIRASVSRLCTQLSFHPESTSPPPALVESVAPSAKDATYREFWDPIRGEPNGLFAGKPARGRWITKGVRGLTLDLVVQNHASFIVLSFYKASRAKRREKALKLFPAAQYPYELRETPGKCYVRFHVLDKGIKDREHWPEIRKRLTTLGRDIFHKVSDSDV